MPLVRPPPANPTTSTSTAQPPKRFPTIVECPRPNYVPNLNDWLQITFPRPFANFDLCPDCYNNSFKNTRYAQHISAFPPKPAEVSTACDFSNLWCRIAYAWLYMQDAPDLLTMASLSEMTPDADGVCPNLNLEDADVKKGEKPTVTRSWYCLFDPKTNSLVDDMTVCSDCIAHINHICPNLRGIFYPVENGQKLQATCDLMMLGTASTRSVEYLDQMIDLAEKTVQTGTRDVSPLVTFIKKWAPVPICKRGQNAVGDKHNYTLPSTVPEFTACEECYLNHIQPLRDSSPQLAILSQIQCSVPGPYGFTCDLYSPRLIQYFEDAVKTNDLQSLRQKLQARNTKLQDTKLRLEQMGQESQQLNMQAQMHQNMMQMQQISTMNQNLAWTATGYIAPPVC